MGFVCERGQRERKEEREREREKGRGFTRAPPRDDDDEDTYDALGPDSRAAFLCGLRRRVFKFLLSSSCVGNLQLPSTY